MTRYIITRNAWGDGMKAEASIVPELILPFESLKAKCREIGVEFITEPEIKDGMDILCAFFIDCPPDDDPLLKRWVHKGIPHLFLMICENLYLQPNKTYAGIGPFADRIFSYESKPPFPDKTVKLRYPVNLREGQELRQKALRNERPYLLGMIASFKQSDAPGSLYGKRAEYAFQMSMAIEDKFALWGRGWQETGFGRSAKGYLPPGLTAKHDALSHCEFALCLENNNSIGGYVTEKLFNALIAGCIPIYEYADDKSKEIPEECFINARKFGHPIEMLNYMEAMTSTQKDDMIQAGVNFLSGLSAAPFDSRIYVDTLYEAIKEIL